MAFPCTADPAPAGWWEHEGWWAVWLWTPRATRVVVGPGGEQIQRAGGWHFSGYLYGTSIHAHVVWHSLACPAPLGEQAYVTPIR